MLKQPKISNITALFTDDIFNDDIFDEIDEDEIIENEDGSIELPIFLWYRSNDLYDVEIDDEKIDEILDECFEHLDFPEYKQIACAIYNYINENDIDTDHLIVNVMADEKSRFAKGHEDKSGFIRLFTLIFHDTHLTHLKINMHLISERIELTINSEKKKFFDEEKLEDETIVNDDKCVICLSNTGQLIETPCHHKYHLNCIRQTPKLICPLCKTNLIDFLTDNDVTEEEIVQKIKDEEQENELVNFNDALNTIEFDELLEIDDIEFAKLCLENLKLHNGSIVPYNELLIDMIKNASHLFGEISHIKSKKEKGAFIYLYETPMEFIVHTKNQQMPSIVNWLSETEFDGAPFYNHIKNKLDSITDTSKQFAVVIIIDNMINVKIIDHDASNNNFRISEHDIMTSLLRCNICRCSGDTPTSPNKEYKWAKTVLNNMKRKYKKNLLKIQYRKHKKEQSKVPAITN
ncbi:RING finger domain protein [Klosneuvirus KNV1]|uniref:RING finger domain protein n=1 Tax=Klosneuvirus KNV1 TaxID=1977640 RepID=A0A1V0SKT7_9VIRU|nr:RING finger domain protein [Klosneuvirus KNV1]